MQGGLRGWPMDDGCERVAAQLACGVAGCASCHCFSRGRRPALISGSELETWMPRYFTEGHGSIDTGPGPIRLAPAGLAGLRAHWEAELLGCGSIAGCERSSLHLSWRMAVFAAESGCLGSSMMVAISKSHPVPPKSEKQQNL